MINILRRFSTPLFKLPKFNFSEYFREKDELEMNRFIARKQIHLPYLRMKQLWEIPLQKKRLRQKRIQQIKASKTKTAPDTQKLVVHNPAVGIEYPLEPSEYFCILNIKGFQCKIMENCKILIESCENYEINDKVERKIIKVTFNDVLLIASKDFTLLGRPFVKNATVQGVIQEKILTDKLIVLKKKRRKQYKKSYGARAKLISVRINKINYAIQQEHMNKAVALQ